MENDRSIHQEMAHVSPTNGVSKNTNNHAPTVPAGPTNGAVGPTNGAANTSADRTV